MLWDSDLYLEFANERNQPCVDLLSRLNREFERILDLGCGPGNSTKNLLDKYGKSTVIGFDSSVDMLKKAKCDYPSVEFVKGCAPKDFNKLTGKFDLVFSNACIHWIENQEELIEGVCELLNGNGVFAAQIPLTDESHFYRVLHRLIEEKWDWLSSINSFHNLNQEGYYNTLSGRFGKITMWKSDYYHIVDSNAVIEWYKGSGLRPYLALLSRNRRIQTRFVSDK